MSGGKTWMHRAFPALPPAEAERLVAGLSEPDRHELHSLMAKPRGSRQLAGMARIYSQVIGNLLAEAARKPLANRRRHVLWRLSEGDIHRKGVIEDLAKEIGSSRWLCSELGLPAGPKLEARRKRHRTVSGIVKEMRKVVRAGGRPYILAALEEARLDTFFAFEDLGEGTGETVSPGETGEFR